MISNPLSNHRRKTLLTCAALIGLGGALGCGQAEPVKSPVSGRVTIDGKPVQIGEIKLIPAGAVHEFVSARVVDGTYSTRAKLGKYQLSVRAFNVGPDTEYVDGMPIAKNIVPARYNTRSELAVEVTKVGPNEFNFDLKL